MRFLDFLIQILPPHWTGGVLKHEIKCVGGVWRTRSSYREHKMHHLIWKAFQHFNIVKLAKDKMLDCFLKFSCTLNSFNYLPAGELGKEGTLKPMESPSEAISSSFNLSSSLLITRIVTASTQIISMRNLKEIRNHLETLHRDVS